MYFSRYCVRKLTEKLEIKVIKAYLKHGCKKCELGEPSSAHIGNFSCILVFTYC